MVHGVPVLPHGHGEVLTSPPFAEWAALMRRNAAEADGWSFPVAGRDARALRRSARAESLASAAEFSARLGVPVARGSEAEHLVVTGHQPELYHPGVWIKVFLAQRLAEEAGASAIDLVVDSDSFDAVGITAPCLDETVRRCRSHLAVGGPDVCYACTPVPSAEELEAFCEGGAKMLATLPTWAVARHFADFCELLRGARPDARNLSELITFARRRYEAPVQGGYLELPVTSQSATGSFLLFLAHIAQRAARFADIYNDELAAFRRATKTRSSAQPFPDLEVDGDFVELPFWHVERTGRSAVRVRLGRRIEIHTDGGLLAELGDAAEAADALARTGAVLAPKAAALTMFARLFVADLFVHGVGGGRYDRVTDGVIRRFFGVEPPRFVVASMTMYLPLGGFLVTADEVSAAEQRLHRLEHNPDQMLAQVDFESAAERRAAEDLAATKSRLVAEIKEPAADKKAIGQRIRDVNEELAGLLAPFAEELRAERDRLSAMAEASEVVTDRTYPFCFWSPLEIQDKAR